MKLGPLGNVSLKEKRIWRWYFSIPEKNISENLIRINQRPALWTAGQQFGDVWGTITIRFAEEDYTNIFTDWIMQKKRDMATSILSLCIPVATKGMASKEEDVKTYLEQWTLRRLSPEQVDESGEILLSYCLPESTYTYTNDFPLTTAK